jgi:hypothetical protein
VSVDLSDYTASFLYEVNPPGQTLINPSQDEIVGRLSDSFWECKFAGFLPFMAYTCDDTGIITPYAVLQANGSTVVPTPSFPDQNNPFNGTTSDLDREYIQVIILMAGYRALISTMQNIASSSTYKAGSVEASTSRSTQMYVAALKAITAKIDIALTRLSDLGSTSVAVLDSVIDSTIAIADGNSWFVSAGNDYPSGSWNGY